MKVQHIKNLHGIMYQYEVGKFVLSRNVMIYTNIPLNYVFLVYFHDRTKSVILPKQIFEKMADNKFHWLYFKRQLFRFTTH